MSTDSISLFIESLGIQKISHDLDHSLRQKIENKTKPPGSLGLLEEVAFQVGRIQQSLNPQIKKPQLFVFAGDHGICEEGVNPFPQEVTRQMVLNFLNQGAAINAFCKTLQIPLKVVDCGILNPVENSELISMRLGAGTANFTQSPAMTSTQLLQALQNGVQLIKSEAQAGMDLFMGGEMGIGNSTVASALYSALLTLSPEQTVGAGTGANDMGIQRKIIAIQKALDHHRLWGESHVSLILQFVGGFEIATLVGAYLGCAQNKIPMIVDGFISTAAWLCASRFAPQIVDYTLFAHCSAENAHQNILKKLKLQPLLDLGLRLGEGTGAALAYPLIQCSLSFLNQMASFAEADVSGQS